MKASSKKTVLDFTKNLVSLLNSGVNLKKAVEICAIADKRFYQPCMEIKKELDTGNSLYDSMKSCTSLEFSSLYLNFIKIGEKSGELKSVFSELAEYLENAAKNRQRMMQAMLYPCFICILTVFLAVFILFYIYPKFSLILQEFSSTGKGGDLMQTLEASKRYFRFFSLLAVFLFFCFLGLKFSSRKNKKIKYLMDFLKLKIPVYSQFCMTKNCADFAFVMNLLCQKGFSLVEGMETAHLIVENECFKKNIDEIRRKLCEGCEISDCFSDASFFPVAFISWMKISAETGNVAESFFQIKKYFKESEETKIQLLLSTMEPFFVLVAGSMVLFMVIKFVLPLFFQLGGAI